MRNSGNSIEIDIDDYPRTIYRALLGSLAAQVPTFDPDHTGRWAKTVGDARGALQDGFGLQEPDSEMLNPGGSARLFIGKQAMTEVLINYGSQILENDDEHDELEAVETLLQATDSL